MKSPKFSFAPEYTGTRALIIGINQYQNASTLSYAVNDAEAVAELLTADLGFPPENVTLLKDSDATKQQIIEHYMKFTSDEVALDERILLFFAGHGYTQTGNRQEVGFLMPQDGDSKVLSTLIRWDEFTRNAELIPAKHMLFIMDACYGGTAITRAAVSGSVRYLRDMLNRYSRQVLTAGKADELVADSGGPIPGHSVFTGHLLEALSGKAADKDGILTANSLMTYVCHKVGTDASSFQTPHYGYVDGDGDFIFQAPVLDTLEKSDTKGIDTLVVMPIADVVPNKNTYQQKIETIKQLLSDDTSVIALHDFVIQEIREFLASTGEDHFKIDGVKFSLDEFRERLSKYEIRVESLAAITACIAYWAKPPHQQILKKTMMRVADRLESRSGLIAWSYLRWYPILIQLYSAGIAAVEGKRYDSLASLFCTNIDITDHGDGQKTLIELVANAILEYNRIDLFKQLPEHERQFTPVSEYLHKLLQPTLDDLFFIGKSYEASFDEFEVLFALAVACIRKQKDRHVWGPIGRFGWKHRSVTRNSNPLTKLIATAKKEKENWPPLKAGLFDGNYDTFVETADEYEQAISNLGWL